MHPFPVLRKLQPERDQGEVLYVHKNRKPTLKAQDFAVAMANLHFASGAAPSHLQSLPCRHLPTPPQLLTGQYKLVGDLGFSHHGGIRLRSHAWHVESKLSFVAASGLSDGVSEGTEGGWCGLCGDCGGWLTCGRCMGEGGFPTRPGLAGVKAKVGWGRCKTCFGQTVVPCLLCGISDVSEWKRWLEHARRHPHRSHKQINAS